MKSVNEFIDAYTQDKKISMVTCYDYWSAKILSKTNIDAVLVGDSAAMVMHGYETTVNATIEMMEMHIKAVSKGLKNKFLVGDMPFLAHRKGLKETIDAVDILIKAGAQAIKIEGANGQIDIIKHVINSGVPVMGHLGLTPQSIHQFGGFKVQGKDENVTHNLINSAMELQNSGVFAIVLELIPADVAERITDKLSIPTIGIGAGPKTSGQILVFHDLLGMDDTFKPKFLRKFMNGNQLITETINSYDAEVKAISFPSEKESF
jgi:3-methyl-2-oxobutanoate hydroxymethyltransferase